MHCNAVSLDRVLHYYSDQSTTSRGIYGSVKYIFSPTALVYHRQNVAFNAILGKLLSYFVSIKC